MAHLIEETQWTIIQAALADGQATTNSSRVNMAGYDGVLIVGMPGTITGTGTATLTVKQAATDAVGDALSGAEAVASGSADSGKLLIIDIFRPTDQYIGTTLVRATANSVWNGTLAIQYNARSKPTTEAAAQLAAAVISLVTPAEA